MIKPKISFFVHDLAANPVVRAAPLARALGDKFEVEIIGFLFSGSEVYAPYRDQFEFKALPCSLNMASVLASLPKLSAAATGGIIYACKPLWTSLAPALLASGLGRRKPLLLDVEDDEWVPMGRSWPQVLWRDVINGWRHATAWKYTVALHPMTRLVSGTTVASTRLQRRYGGTLIRHGPDATVFDATRPEFRDPARSRTQFNLPQGVPLALFAGLPQPHKGWNTLLVALERPECQAWHLVLAGPRDHPDFATAQQRLPLRTHNLGSITQTQMPALLAAVNTVPVPQGRMRFAASQVPAKALEAMAMSLPVIASRVGDLPTILGQGERGWLVDPEDPTSLALALAEIAASPQEARRRGQLARQWFLSEASMEVIRVRLRSMLERHLGIDAP